ncbi:MAG: ABC transporter permease [Clostridia bacterium]|nr:ABC transporter permease [Clostridia bacterium]
MVKKFFAKGYIFLVLAFMYVPILLLVAYSFTSSTVIGKWTDTTLQLYPDLFKHEEIMTAVKNTLLVAFSSAAIATLLGTTGAIGIFYSKQRTQKVLNGISQIPVVNAEIVTAISLALTFAFLFSENNFLTLLIGHVVLSAPFVLLSVMPKLKQLDPHLYEAALDLGATPARALFTVVLPEILSGVFSGFMLAVTLSLDDYIITMFTKNTTFQTLSTYIFDIQAKRPLPAELRALSALLFLLLLVIVIVINVRASKAEKARSN